MYKSLEEGSEILWGLVSRAEWVFSEPFKIKAKWKRPFFKFSQTNGSNGGGFEIRVFNEKLRILGWELDGCDSRECVIAIEGSVMDTGWIASFNMDDV